MSNDILYCTLGTVTLWTVSVIFAVLLALLLASASLSHYRSIRLPARAMVNITRGVPTSLLVLTAGLGMIRLGPAIALPAVFPGTHAVFQPVAWGVAIALALGSAGHLCEIFLAARQTLGYARIEQLHVLGFSSLTRLRLMVRECAAAALPPTGARLVHHLHNTAFAALFPVAELFGAVHSQVNATFRVFEFALLGAGVYVALSAVIWLSVRGLEALLLPPRTLLGQATTVQS